MNLLKITVTEIPIFADALKLKEDNPANVVFMVALNTVYDKGDNVTEHIHRLSLEARLVYLLCCFNGEIHNGGFDQLFTNSLGKHCIEILAHLESVGACKSHALLTRAIAWFPDALPSKDRMTRWLQYESFSEKPEYKAEMEYLDAEFYKDEDLLVSRINAYVARHPTASIRA
jgi:hypothetical protein